VNQLMDLRLGGTIYTWPLTTSVCLWCNGASRTVTAQQLFHKPKANAKDVGESPLPANSTLVGMQDFLSQTNRIARHTR
jgi:hypothetical protein